MGIGLSIVCLAAPKLLASQDIPVLQEIQIIGSQSPAPSTGEVVEEEHSGSRERIERKRITRPGAQLGELLGTASGVQQLQSGGFGTFSSITVRAASAAHTAVYLDGILLNSAAESVIDLSTLEALNLDAVDIYKGTSPLQLGQASMGGAANLITRAYSDEPVTRLRVGVGSFSHSTLQGSHQSGQGDWSWTASGSYQNAKNDFGYLYDKNTELNPNDDIRQRRRNASVRRISLLAKAKYQPLTNRRTDILLQVADRESGVPNATNSVANRASFDTSKTQLHLSQVVDRWQSWNTRHSLYAHDNSSLYDDRRSQVGLGAQFIDTQSHTLGAKTYWERFFEHGTTGLSLELREETLKLRDQSSIGEDVNADRQLLHATVHATVFDANERWMLTPAIRLQNSLNKRQTNERGQFQSQATETHSQLGVQLGASYRATESISLTANAGDYFREPSFPELFGSTGLINGNDSLLPEEGTNLDVGVQYKSPSTRLEATVFHSERDELILTSFNAQGIGRPTNIGKARVSGIELSASWKPLNSLELSANSTIQNPRNKNTFGGFQNKQLPGEARRSFFFRSQYKPGITAYWYEWQSANDRFYDSANLLAAENTSIHSIGLDVEHNAWKFGARIQNLGDDTVEDFNGFPKPGRAFSISLARSL